MSPHHHTAKFRLFASSVLTNDVIVAICKLPDKQCATDPLLKDNVDVLAPFITELFNIDTIRGVSVAFQGCIHRPDTAEAESGPIGWEVI